MVLIDTSCWTHALRRKGDPVIRAKVEALLASSQAAWCDPVRLELWNGARNDWDRNILTSLQTTVPVLPVTADVWNLACTTANAARTTVLNVPALDVLIFACARHHGVTIEHADRHYDLLAALP